DYWTGNPQPMQLPASTSEPVLGPDCSPRQSVRLNFRPELGAGDAELVLDALPPQGKLLWVQPVVTNSAGGTIWMPGFSDHRGPPVESKPMPLHVKYSEGTLPVRMKSTARFQLDNGAQSISYLQNIEARLSEKTVNVGPLSSTVMVGIDKFAV